MQSPEYKIRTGRSLRRTLPAIATAVLVLGVLGACGTNDAAPAQTQPDAAADTGADGQLVPIDGELDGELDAELDADETSVPDDARADAEPLDAEDDTGVDGSSLDTVEDTGLSDTSEDATDSEEQISPSDALDDAGADMGAPDAQEDVSADVLVEDVSADVLADVAVDSLDDVAGDVSDDASADVVNDADAVTPAVVEIPDRRVGIFYLAWHTYATQALLAVPEERRLTVERVIRDRSLWVANMLEDFGLTAAAVSFHWHSEPSVGFYCLYRRRPGDPSPGAGDCPNIAAVAENHARLLWDAGVDFVYADLTNLPEANLFADVLGMRPIEVLFEEWSALRARGVPTPQIGVWVPASEDEGAANPLFRRVLELYGRSEYRDLVLRHEPTGQPILFVVDRGGLSASARFLAEIEAAGVIPVRTWGNSANATLQAGAVGWMQPCVESGQFTTLIRPEQPCGQYWSPATPIGSVVSVSASYQVGYASMPFQASGRHEGLTLKKQFETAFAVQPDYVLINAWNEHIAQPQPNPYSSTLGNLRLAMGLGSPPAGQAYGDAHWVDVFGSELSRDLEPTVEGGDGPYEVMQSCIRVYRASDAGCASPAAAGEACCDLSGGMALVYSLRREFDDGQLNSDHVPTLSREERDGLVRSGAFDEVCNVAYGPPGLCGDGQTADGPFLIWRSPAPDRTLIYRCFSGVDHFMSPDPACEGTTLEGPLGWVSRERSGAAPRPLRRCNNEPAVAHFHWLDEACPSIPGVIDEALLGYVR